LTALKRHPANSFLVRPATWLWSAMAQISDDDGFDRLLVWAGDGDDEVDRAKLLRAAANSLTKSMDGERLRRVLELAQELQTEKVRATAIDWVAQAYVGAGQLEKGLALWKTNLVSTYTTIGAPRLARALQTGAPILASIDKGETLWQTYQALVEVAEWWTEPLTRGSSHRDVLLSALHSLFVNQLSSGIKCLTSVVHLFADPAPCRHIYGAIDIASCGHHHSEPQCSSVTFVQLEAS
jgi:hypothetical protein